MKIDASILIAVRVLIALVFATAVLGKLRHRHEFIGVVANYRLLPEWGVTPVAYLVVVLEAGVVISLATGIRLRGGAVLAMLLLCVFSVAMTVNLLRGRREIDCGCFQSALRQRLSPALIVRNLLLMLALLPLLAAQPQFLLWPEALNGVAGGLVMFVLYQVLGQVLALQEAAQAIRKRFV